MKEDELRGWYDAPAAKTWKCPSCGGISPVADWWETTSFCEDCGEHDARECPLCLAVFDHVWGSETIESGDTEQEE